MKYQLSNGTCPEELITPMLSSLHPACLDILHGRGFQTSEEMESFLFPSLSKVLQTQVPLMDMEQATAILKNVVENGQPVVIYHDYDADGITAAAVVKDSLTYIKVPVFLHCNDRSLDGFGMCRSGIDAIMSKYPGVKTIITVDNGITAVDAVTYAKEQGFTVILTDHHEPGTELPEADAVIDNHRKDEPVEQDHNCCGAGIAWKLMLALYLALGYDITPVMNALDLVALGTIADVVPLLGDNRAMVQEGLRQINAENRPFFRKLMEVLSLQTIDAQTIGYKIAPMLNAVSRMEHSPSPVVETLLCTDEEQLQTDILYMDTMNQQRKDETARELQLVLNSLPDENTLPIILFADESLKEGIVGIVAGQITQQYHVPCGIFARSMDGHWKGSLRAPDGFSLKETLDQCTAHLKSYGGHAKAAGATVFAEKFEEFRKDMLAFAQKWMDEQFTETAVTIDKVVRSAELTTAFVEELRILEPYGEGNPAPLFGLIADVAEIRYMGAEQQHVKYLDRSGISIIRWGKGSEVRKNPRLPQKFVGYPQLNNFRGNVQVQFISEQ